MKAIVIGGSNGIGLAISKVLINKNYYVCILDKENPEKGHLDESSYSYSYCNLLDLDMELLQSLASDNDVEVLMITAGFGHVIPFKHCHIAEIKNTMMVNATATIEILKVFYNRILSNSSLYCGVMGSISGWMSSPLMSVYAASKAAVCRFIESVNIELEMEGSKNRIMNCSPASIKGTRFNGGENQLELLYELANHIVNNTFARNTLFIPDYEDIYKDVLERYHTNPHDYGIYSYNYKLNSGRVKNESETIVGYLSGTFDLFHVGHLNLLRRAKEKCDYLIVGVHESGKWKGKETFISLEDRKAIVGACKYVDKVVDSCREDADAWSIWHYDRLFVGSDYIGTERFKRYEEYFKDKNVQIVYFPYTQGVSSTQLRNRLSGAE